MARSIRYMEDKLESIEKAGGGASVQQQEREVLRDAARAMFATLPHMFRAVKHRARTAEQPGPIKEIGDSQLWVLTALTRGRQLTSELARSFNVTNPTMTRIVDALVEKGYVERQPDAEDRRCIYLRLTREGEAIGEHAHAQFRAMLTEFISPLTDEQLADIIRACRHIATLLPEGMQDSRESCPIRPGGAGQRENAPTFTEAK
ncbi:MAG TPA: MarR family transcriptional regulator [Chloroflexia bacterium]|nr:MarR family transcriptional regulator [Chloroflexia bacterium]